MTLAILKQTKDQKVARPFNRACSLNEAAEIIAYYIEMNSGPTTGQRARADKASDAAHKDPSLYLLKRNVDTDRPVYEALDRSFKLYIFTEE